MSSFDQRDPWNLKDGESFYSPRDDAPAPGSGQRPGGGVDENAPTSFYRPAPTQSGEPRYAVRPPGFGRPAPSGFPYRRLLRFNSNILCGGLILVFGFMVGFVYVIRYIGCLFPDSFGFLSELSPVQSRLINSFVNILSLLLPCLMVRSVLDIPARAAFPLRIPRARLAVPGVFCCLGMSVVGVYISAYFSALLTRFFATTPVMPEISPPYGLPETVAHLVGVALVPAVMEELLFRGVVMQSLRPFGDGFAMVTSSILFAMSHGNLVQGPNAMAVGLLLGYFALRSGSILTPIIMHFANNILAAGASVAMLHMPGELAQMLNFVLMPVYLILGLIGALMMIRLNHGFISPRRSACTLSEQCKYGLFFTSPLAIVFILVAAYFTMLYMA